MTKRYELSESWRKKQQRLNPEYERHRNLWRKYRIRPATYAIMLKAQGGLCGICNEPPTEGKNLVVDHDHATGKVRGLLCNTCNIGLGGFKDTVGFLYAAVRYLEVHGAGKGA